MVDLPAKPPTPEELAAALRKRGAGGWANDLRGGGCARYDGDHLLVDAAQMLENMAVHLHMIADEKGYRSPGGLQELRAANGLSFEMVPYKADETPALISEGGQYEEVLCTMEPATPTRLDPLDRVYAQVGKLIEVSRNLIAVNPQFAGDIRRLPEWTEFVKAVEGLGK